MPNTKMYWVYILACDNGALYTGYTDNLTKRFEAHCKGTASKFTRSFKPLKIAQAWQVAEKKTALQLEHRIKQLTREQKDALIADPSQWPGLLMAETFDGNR